MSSSHLPTVSQSLLLTQDLLINLVNLPQAKDILQASFGDGAQSTQSDCLCHLARRDRFDVEAAISWLETETQNNFSNFPHLEILTAREINNADGAYSADTKTIYLSAEFVTDNANNPHLISNVILEEYGHFLDSKFNLVDTPGDEGNLFTNLVQGKTPEDRELAAIKAEEDRQNVVLDNQTIEIEQSNPGDNPAFDLIGLTQLRNDPQFTGIDGSGSSVVVIDTGMDVDHPLIAPNYITGYDFVDDDNDPSDSGGHGTHVAGIIGARDDTIGVAPNVGLISLRVLDTNGGASLTKIEDALEWTLENRQKYNITAVNFSLGEGFYTSELEVPGDIISDDIRRLEDSGVTVIAATGNDYFTNSAEANRANLSFPAISSTVAVGAVWQDGSEPNATWESGSIDFSTGADRITSFSQRLDAANVVFAPGALITSTLLGGGIGQNAGTSQASPHVAGTVALLQEASLQFSERLLTTDEVVDILRSTGDPITDGDDEDDNVINTDGSYIRINVYNAVAEIKRRSDNIALTVTGEGTAPGSQENDNLKINSGNDIVSGTMVYRFFRPDIGVHFYTASEVERDSIIDNLPNYAYEGESYIAAASTADPLTGARPVYRFFNTSTGAHLYTMSEVERDSISNNLANYNYEGIAYYGYERERPEAIPLYRFYNRVVDAHFYTPSAAEKDAVLANLPDYQLESNAGVAFYVEPIAEI